MLTTNPETSSIRTRLGICFVLALATAAAYWPVTQFEFINYDDSEYVTHNDQVLRGWTLPGIRWAFQTGHAANWHPLTWLSHMLDAQFFGLHAGGHHLTSLLFHLVNALLLFLVLDRMTGAVWRSAFVAALFALHPLHVESVAWVAERKDVLSTFFGLLSIWSYVAYSQLKVPSSKFQVRYSRFPASVFYSCAVLFFACSLMSKPMLVTLPFLLLLLDYWPLGRLSVRLLHHSSTPPLRLVMEKLPFFALAATSSVITVLTQTRAGAVTPFAAIPMEWRLANALMAYGSYLAKAFWPHPLAVFYPYRQDWHTGVVLMVGLLLLVLSAAVSLSARLRPWLFVGWFWFLGTLVPVIGLVQVGAQAMADRYTYLPLIGIFLIVAWGTPVLLHEWRHRKAVLAALGWAAVAVCLAATPIQLAYWRNTETLCRHALRVTKENFAAHAALGAYFLDQGKTEAAKAELTRTLALHPQHAVAYYLLGSLLVRENKFDEAISHLEAALRINPALPEAHNELANLFISRGLAEAGITHALQALALSPDSPDAHFNVGGGLLLQGKLREALPHYQIALKASPEFAEAHLNCGKALFNLGKLEEAEIHLRQARRLQPGNIEAHRFLAAVYSGQNRPREQSHEYAEMLRLAPDWPEVLNNLAWLLATHPHAETRDGARAVTLAERACAITGRTNLWFLSTLAAAYAEAGRFSQAISTQQVVCELAAAQKQTAEVETFQRRLDLYRSGHAYHKP